ncbi:MAG TPA: hypothetical protein VFW07_10980 [Parafilimonas sp.]|nr:hypothetical protein [Parafilimonas sp.]
MNLMKGVHIKALLLLSVCLYSYINISAQVAGCPDPAANNYNALATVNDGSCTYNNTSVTPVLKTNLSTTVNETSGLLWWNKQVWTHNDSGGEKDLYTSDSTNGNILKTIALSKGNNVDWEDIAQDNKFFYVGDFGNNKNGNRTNLRIYRIKKSELKTLTTVKPGVIKFSYSDQTDFTPKGSNNTNFDCEALIAYGDSLFLFSKDWVDNKTRLYKLPKLPGTYVAQNIGELKVGGLVTGAEVIPDKKVIVLTGYNALLSPFIYLLYDFTGNHFFDANKRKVTINQGFLQMEGICAVSGTRFFISNERLSNIVPAKLQAIDLSALLNPYYSKLQGLKSKAAPMATNKFQSHIPTAIK